MTKPPGPYSTSLDDLVHQLLPEVLLGNVGAVLGRNDNGIDGLGNRHAVFNDVLDGDLGLGVGPEPRANTVTAGLRKLQVELVRQHKGHGHELGGLVGGVAKHDTLGEADQCDFLDGCGRWKVPGHPHRCPQP